jgi:hypothetical protein
VAPEEGSLTMSDGVDTNDTDEVESSTDDPPHSDAAQEPGETDSEAVEPAEDPSAGEDGEQQVDSDDAGDVAGEEDSATGDGAQSEEAKAPDPSPPAGFTSWDEAFRARDEEARRLRTQWEQVLPLLNRTLEQSAAKPAAPPEPAPPASPWTITRDPEVRKALGILRVNKDAFEKLPEATRAKALQAQTFISDRWDEYTVNPEAFVEEVILPKLDGTKYAAKLIELEKKVARYEEEDLRRRGREELQKHAGVLKTPQDQQELVKLVTEHQIPLPLAVQFIAQKQQLAELQSQRSKIDEKAKSQAASSQRTRAAQGTKRGQRPGKPSAELFKTTDAREIAARLKSLGHLE